MVEQLDHVRGRGRGRLEGGVVAAVLLDFPDDLLGDGVVPLVLQVQRRRRLQHGQGVHHLQERVLTLLSGATC